MFAGRAANLSGGRGAMSVICQMTPHVVTGVAFKREVHVSVPLHKRNDLLCALV